VAPGDLEKPLDPLVMGDDRPEQYDVVAMLAQVALDVLVVVVADVDVEQVGVGVALLVQIGHHVAETDREDLGRRVTAQAAIDEKQPHVVLASGSQRCFCQ
jgi:hypothetical protein